MTQVQKPSEILRAARELISVPERWTQGVLARDAHGKSVQPDTNAATCWCASGAIRRAQGSNGWTPYGLLGRVISGNIPDFNDHHSHPEILAAFDAAIALAEKAEVES